MSCKSCNSFGSRCPCHKNQFGMFPVGVRRVSSFPQVKPKTFTHQRNRGCVLVNEFGTKSQSVKGYSSLTKKMLTDFYVINGIDVDMSASKDKLYSNLKKIYSNISPTDIKQSVATLDTIGNIRASKQRQKEAEERAKRNELEQKTKAMRDKIKKITYTPREPTPLYEFVSARLPAGSKIKRLTRPEVKQSDVDDLADMFSSARASPDEMSDLLTKLSVKFGKNKFGA